MPKIHPKIKTVMPNIGTPKSWGAPLGTAAYVVANAWEGFGAPLMVTVGALESGVAPLSEEATENLFDVVCRTPCVELTKRRK